MQFDDVITATEQHIQLAASLPRPSFLPFMFLQKKGSKGMYYVEGTKAKIKFQVPKPIGGK